MIFFVRGKQVRRNISSNGQDDATTVVVAILPIRFTELIYNKIANRKHIRCNHLVGLHSMHDICIPPYLTIK